MRKFVAWILIIAFLVRPTSAEAVVPAAVALLAPAVLGASLLAVGATTHYAPAVMGAGQTAAHAVSGTAGEISRAAYVTRTVQMAVAGVAKDYVFGKMMTLEISMKSVLTWAKTNPTVAPTISSLLAARTSSASLGVGSVVDLGGVNYRIDSLGVPSGPLNASWDSPPETSMNSFFVSRGAVVVSGGYLYLYPSPLLIVNIVSTTQVVIGSVTYNNFSYYTQTATLSPTTDPVSAAPGVVDYPGFADDYNAAPPAAILPEIDAYIAQNPNAVTVPGLNAADIAHGHDLVAAAAAHDIADVAATVAAANPTDTALQIAAAQAAADATAADVLASETANQPDVKPDVSPSAAPVPDADVVIDLSPLLGLKDLALSRFPFSTIAGLSGFFDSLTASPTAPAFSLSMPFGMQPYNLSLSSLDGIAEKWRMALAFFFHAGCIYAIIRRYA